MGDGHLVLVRAWWWHRTVHRATVAVCVITALVLALCARQVRRDESVVAATDLVTGHRYLLVPLVLLAMLGAGLAGSIATWDAASGWSAQLATADASTGRGWAAQIIAGGVAAAWWTLCAATSVSAAAVGVFSLVGGAPGLGSHEMVELVSLVARTGATAGGVGALATAVGVIVPASPLPALLPVVGALALEAAALVSTDGRVNVLGGGTYAIAVVGVDQAHQLGADRLVAAAVTVTAWGVLPVVAVVLVAGVARWRRLS